MNIKYSIMLVLLSGAIIHNSKAMDALNRALETLDAPAQIEISNQSENLVHAFYKIKNCERGVGMTVIAPFEDTRIDDKTIPTNKTFIVFTQKGRFGIYENKSRETLEVQHFLAKEEKDKSKWYPEIVTMSELPLSGVRKVIVLVNPDGSILLNSGSI